MTTQENKRLEDAVFDATEAFWEVIAAHYEEITTGDLDPVTTLNLNQTLTEVVKTWLAGNTPQTKEIHHV